MNLSRRQWLAGALGATIAPNWPGHAWAKETPARITGVEWASAETLEAVGVSPLAIASPYPGGQEDMVRAMFPRGTVGLGSLFEPNLELLQSLQPDLIFCTYWQSNLLPSLRRIAPTHVCDLRGPTPSLLGNSFLFLREMGGILGRQDAAAAYAQASEAELDVLARRLVPFRRPLLIGALQADGRHILLYDKGSLFDDVLGRLRLVNAWQRVPSASGGTLVGIETLADFPAADLLHFDTGAPTATALRLLRDSALWAALPPVRAGRVRVLPYAWPFGALPTAMAFARSVARLLSSAIAGEAL